MYKILRRSTNIKLCKLGNTYAVSILVSLTQNKISKKRCCIRYFMCAHIFLYVNDILLYISWHENHMI